MKAIEDSLCDSCKSEISTSGETDLCGSFQSEVSKSGETDLCDSCQSEIQASKSHDKDLCDKCYESSVVTTFRTSSFTTLNSTNDVDLDSLTKRSNRYIKLEQQHELAQIQYYRELIQQQMIEYQKIRLEEERFEQELISMKQYSKELDQTMRKVWTEAQEAIEKDTLFRTTYKALMDQEEPQIKQTAKYLRQTVPIRDELFGTLCVTSQTEKHAVENAADLQMDYRRRIKDSLQTRTRLNQKLRTFRQIVDKAQEQKKITYNEISSILAEIEQLDAERELLRIEKRSSNQTIM